MNVSQHLDQITPDAESLLPQSPSLSNVNHRQPQRHAPHCCGMTGWVLLVMLLGTTFNLLYLGRGGILSPDHNHTLPQKLTDCGEDLATARSRNCTFSIMHNNWVPELCVSVLPRNATLESNFQFFSDQNLRIEDHVPPSALEGFLADQALREEQMRVYTSEVWHKTHCLYMAAIGERALEMSVGGAKDVWIPRGVINRKHTDHCAELLQRNTRDGGYVVVEVGFTGCVRIA
jgi:hypothetical protein